MELSLTKTQLLERLLEPQRVKLLSLAINEDAKQVFPLHLQVQAQSNQAEINIDITEALGKLASKWLLRAIALAYEDSLD